MKPLNDIIKEGNDFLKRNQLEQAEAVLSDAMRFYPDHAELHFILGVVLFRKNRFEEAVDQFEKAHRLDPNDVAVLNNLGLLYYKLEKYHDAEEIFAKVLALKPQYPEALYNFGRLKYDQDRWIQSYFLIHACLNIDPSHTSARTFLDGYPAGDIVDKIKEQYKSIMIVMEEGIGNMVMLTPALKAIKEVMPEGKLTVMGRQPSIQLIQNWDVVDKILTEPDEEQYDLCFLTVWSNQFQKTHHEWIKKHCEEYIHFGLEKDQHEAEAYLRMAKSLGYRDSLPRPFCQVKAVDIELSPDKKVVAISDTTLNNGAWERKRWPYYKELADVFIKAGYIVLLIGGKGEARQFREEDWPTGVINCLGKYDLQETAGLLEKCDLFVGNDSGPAHMAAALGIKTFVFFGPTLLTKNCPKGLRVCVIKTDLPCSPCQYTQRWDECREWRCMNEMTLDRVKRILFGQIQLKSGSAHSLRERLNDFKLIQKDYSKSQLVEENDKKFIVCGDRKEPLCIHLVGAGKANFPWGMENEVIRALELTGVEIIETDYRLERENLAELFLRPAHLMLVCKGSGIPPELIKKYPGRTHLWYPDDIFTTQHGPRDLAYNGHAFDTVFSFDRSAVQAYSKFGIKDARYLPLGMSPFLHRKLDLEREHDVTFIGNIHPNRKPFLERLQQHFDVLVRRAFMDEMVAILNKSRIVLNLGIGPTGIQQRVFEVLGCGSFLLTNEIPEADRLFEDRKHLVYFNDENIIDLVAFYLEHDEEREAIAEQGYREAHDKHTLQHRIEQMLKEVFPQKPSTFRAHHSIHVEDSKAQEKRITLPNRIPVGMKEVMASDDEIARQFRGYSVDSDWIRQILDSRIEHISDFYNESSDGIKKNLIRSTEALEQEWNRLSSRGIRHFYEKTRHYIYDLAHSEFSGSSWRLEYLARIIGPYLHRESRFLDYGAGLGELGVFFSKICDVTLLDVPGYTQNFAKLHSRKLRANIRFINELAEAEVYDVISCQDCLEHIENAMDAVKNIHRALRIGGYFITSGFWFSEKMALHLNENVELQDTFIGEFARLGLDIEHVVQGNNWTIGIFKKIHWEHDRSYRSENRIAEQDAHIGEEPMRKGYRPEDSKKNKAVVVVNIGRVHRWGICMPSVEAYCEKYDLDLHVITEVKYQIQALPDYNYLTFEKNQVYDCFEKYDRILRLDSDALITPHCPNVFDIVPEDAIGAVFEDVGSRAPHRRMNIKKVQEELGDVNWRKNYFNSGVIVISRCHRDLFRLTDGDIALIQSKHLGEMKEQTFLNWRVRQQNIPVHELDFRFNHMSMFSEEWNGRPDPLESYILHYAGVQGIKVAKIRSDFNKIWSSESTAPSSYSRPLSVCNS